jgi:hypothetical protein
MQVATARGCYLRPRSRELTRSMEFVEHVDREMPDRDRVTIRDQTRVHERLLSFVLRERHSHDVPILRACGMSHAA